MEIAAIFLPFSFIGGAERLFLETVTLLRERNYMVDVYNNT